MQNDAINQSIADYEDALLSQWEEDGGAAVADPDPMGEDPIEPYNPEPIYS